MLNTLANFRFAELSEVMLDHAGVSMGRQFGRDCLKYGRHSFIVLDRNVLAFRTGPNSVQLVEDLPAAWLWNPNGQPRPKLSWVASLPQDSELICTLALHAFDWIKRRPRLEECCKDEVD